MMQTKLSSNRDSMGMRPVEAQDVELLYEIYASTRREELAATGWDGAAMDAFLRMQFQLQHAQYRQNYPTASFDIILVDGLPAGRLYVDRRSDGIRMMDIALLPQFRGRGIGAGIIRRLVGEADGSGQVLSLHVERNNPILGFYSALGFRTRDEGGVYLYMEREPAVKVPAGEAGEGASMDRLVS